MGQNGQSQAGATPGRVLPEKGDSGTGLIPRTSKGVNSNRGRFLGSPSGGVLGPAWGAAAKQRARRGNWTGTGGPSPGSRRIGWAGTGGAGRPLACASRSAGAFWPRRDGPSSDQVEPQYHRSGWRGWGDSRGTRVCRPIPRAYPRVYTNGDSPRALRTSRAATRNSTIRIGVIHHFPL